MADEVDMQEEGQLDTTVPEIWKLAKPSAFGEGANDDEETSVKPGASTAAKVGKLVKFLNDIEDTEELEAKVQERDPATSESLLLWATLSNRFVLVEWLVKKCKRAAFAFKNENLSKDLTVFDKWVEIRKEIEEREKERLANPPEEPEEGAEEEEDEDKAPEPTADQLVYEALSEFHEEWGNRGQCIVKSIGELGVYQGARDEAGTKTGLGQTLFPNGDAYCGEYADNKRTGLGTYSFTDEGMIYTGAWKDNLRHGVGRMVYTDGGRYFGSWMNDRRCGEGRYTYPDGSSYSGEWADDAKNGRGTYTFTDGSQYVGSFVDGEFVSGEWRLAGGTRYLGTFQNGAPTGKGVFLFKSGKEGAFRQEGSYVNGKWIPSTDVTTSDATPSLDLVVQQKVISLRFTSESGARTIEDLVRVANFAPFKQWIEKLETSTSQYVNDIGVSSVNIDTAGNVTSVRLKVAAVDENGNRIKGTDGIVLKAATTKLLVLLVGGEKTIALVQESPNAAMLSSDFVSLPTVRVSSGSGALGGPFVDTARKALRLSNMDATTTMLLPLKLNNTVDYTNAEQRVVCYIQHVHGDAVQTAQERLDAVCATGSQFLRIRAVRAADIAALSTDAATIIAGHTVNAMIAQGKLPTATVDAQRPPTPIPPPIETRPDIEPLLEAERAKNAPKDEDE